MRARRAGRRPGVENGDHVVDAEGAVGAALHPAPLSHPGPGEQVGVVLDHRRRHDVVGVELQPVGQLVDGLGGVAAEHHHVAVVAASARRTGGRSPGRARRRRWPAGTCTPHPGARSSTTGGSRPPCRPPPAWPASRRRSRGPGTVGRCHRGRGRPVRPRPGRPWARMRGHGARIRTLDGPRYSAGRGRALRIRTGAIDPGARRRRPCPRAPERRAPIDSCETLRCGASPTTPTSPADPPAVAAAEQHRRRRGRGSDVPAG